MEAALLLQMFRESSLSLDLWVGHDRERCKNGLTDRDAHRDGVRLELVKDIFDGGPGQLLCGLCHITVTLHTLL